MSVSINCQISVSAFRSVYILNFSQLFHRSYKTEHFLLIFGNLSTWEAKIRQINIVLPAETYHYLQNIAYLDQPYEFIFSQLLLRFLNEPIKKGHFHNSYGEIAKLHLSENDFLLGMLN